MVLALQVASACVSCVQSHCVSLIMHEALSHISSGIVISSRAHVCALAVRRRHCA